jgi:hypothetical protein
VNLINNLTLILLILIFLLQRPLLEKRDDGSDGLALMHEIESMVDVFQRQAVCDVGIDIERTAHRLGHDAGQLRAALHTAESRAAPHATGHQLERTSGDFFASLRHANDGGLT